MFNFAGVSVSQRKSRTAGTVADENDAWRFENIWMKRSSAALEVISHKCGAYSLELSSRRQPARQYSTDHVICLNAQRLYEAE
jgi:hypothetical protein